jgi:hypothetical protein
MQVQATQQQAIAH